MRKHSLDKIAKVREARKKGHTISELTKEFLMPKTTIWHHIHDIKLSKKYIAIIKSKQGGSKIRNQKDWLKANKHSQEILKSEDKYPCSLIAMLYWAEGNKKDLVFTNTDGQMVKLYLAILRKYFNISEDRIKITIRIFSNLSRKYCINYWSDATGFSKDKFIIYLNDGGIKGKTIHGICRVTIKKSGYLHKLMDSLTKNILQEILINN